MGRRKTGHEIECPTCHKLKYYPLCNIKPIKFCSKSCAMKSKTLNKHKNWKGGHIDQAGYIKIKQIDGRYLFQHRIVMEKYLGRPLTDDEKVHHIDGNKQNNDTSNLIVVTQSEHMAIHGENRIRDIKGRYLGGNI